MMLLGVFAAATTIAIAFTQINRIGATNTPNIPKTTIVEPETKASQLETAPVMKSEVTYSDPGVKEPLAGMNKNVSVERADVKKFIDTDPNRPSAMQFGKDDENSIDWMK
ncbi:MAG: hypothetical protein ACPGPC_09900 [Alphaproteobacteria bacterium]